MNVSNQIADKDGNVIAVFEGISRPWPEFPSAPYKRSVSTSMSCPAYDFINSVGIAPQRIVQDFGASESTKEFNIDISFLDGSTLALLETQFLKVEPVQYTVDGWTSAYLCSWGSDTSLNPDPKKGFSDTAQANELFGALGAYNVKIHLLVIERIA